MSGPSSTKPKISGPPVLGKKNKKKRRAIYSDDELEYEEHRRRKAEKKEKKKKKKKKESSWWDTLLDIGGKVLTHILPMFLGGKKLTYGSMSAHSGLKKRIAAASVPAANPETFRPVGEPLIQSTGPGRVKFTHSGLAGVINSVEDDGTTYYVRGDKMFSIDLTPRLEPWLARMCSYQRFRFRNIAVTIHPSTSTTTAGRVMGYFEEDVDNPLVTDAGQATIEAGAAAGGVITDVWEPHTFVKSFRESDYYYVAPTAYEPRTSKQGRFTIVAASDFDSSFNNSLADVTVAYELEAEEPILQAAGVLGTWQYLSGGTAVTGVPMGNTVTPVSYRSNARADGNYTLDSPLYGNFTPRYSTTSFGSGTTASAFQVPAGFWSVSIYIAGTNLSTWSIAPSGSYGFLSDGSISSWSSTSTSKVVWDGVILSTGYADELSYISFTLGGWDTISGSFIRFTALGGAPSWSNPMALIDARLKQLEKPLPTPKQVPPSTAAAARPTKTAELVDSAIRDCLSTLEGLQVTPRSDRSTLSLAKTLAFRAQAMSSSAPEEIRTAVDNAVGPVLKVVAASNSQPSASSSSH